MQMLKEHILHAATNTSSVLVLRSQHPMPSAQDIAHPIPHTHPNIHC
jgi:hypothetical protein